jgi:radical SAM-linked protein
LPISYSNGFHPSPRIIPASALSLGVTSSGEIMDFELTEPVEPELFLQRIIAQLPSTMPVFRIEEIPLKDDAATTALHRAEYQLQIMLETGVTIGTAQNWVQEIMQAPEIWIDHETNSGKMVSINIRERLFELEIETVNDRTLTLRYIGSCQNNGIHLRPDQLVAQLEARSGQSLSLDKIHRVQLFLNSTAPKAEDKCEKIQREKLLILDLTIQATIHS